MSAIIAASDDEMQAEIERLRAENESLKQQLEDEKQARKTWENEAERRSDRYTNDVAALQQQLAQRVPDGWQLVRTDALKLALDFAVPAMERDRDSPSNSAWMVEAADRNIAAVRSMLASAPPAPQSEELVLWKARALQAEAIVAKFMAPQATVVQQEPFAYYQPECHQNIMEAKWRDREASRSDNSTMIAFAKACTEPLYTHPAQQAKPQPLSDEGLVEEKIECDRCCGKGWNWEEHQVAERKSDLQTIKVHCDKCEGTGYELV